jgi:HK97 family phage prohead protease
MIERDTDGSQRAAQLRRRLRRFIAKESAYLQRAGRPVDTECKEYHRQWVTIANLKTLIPFAKGQPGTAEPFEVRELRYSRPSLPMTEVRSAVDGDSVRLTGLAHRYGVETRISLPFGKTVREIIRKGAFGKAVRARQDTKLLANHDPSLIMARTTNGGLVLRDTDVGLRITATVPRDNITSGYLDAIADGRITQMSFAMSGITDNWIGVNETEAISEIVDIDTLWDTSLVVFPQYKGTSVAVERSTRSRRVPIDSDPTSLAMKRWVRSLT